MAVQQLTDVQIFNLALLSLGQTAYKVTAVDGSDSSKYGQIAYPVYYMLRDEELLSGSWQVAKKRAQLNPAFINGSGTWISGFATVAVTGAPIIALTVTTVNGSPVVTVTAGGPVQSSWVGGTVTSTNIPAASTIIGVNVAAGTITLSANAQAGASGTSATLCNIPIGWQIGQAATQSTSPPAGISAFPSGTVVVSISGSTLTMSNLATQSGGGQVTFVVNNLTGYWYAYYAPSDMLELNNIYSVFPNFTYLWPFKIQHTLKFSYMYEAGYIYTDLDPTNGNPVVEYIVELTSSVANTGPNLFKMDFADALQYRIASAIALAVTGNESIQDKMLKLYAATLARAQGNNAREKTNKNLGKTWWTDRGR